MPAHCTSTGKVLLAGLSDDELDQLYPDPHLEPLTEHSVRTLTELRAQLAEVRKSGFATSREESEEGVASVAVAVPARGFPDEAGTQCVSAELSIPALRCPQSLQRPHRRRRRASRQSRLMTSEQTEDDIEMPSSAPDLPGFIATIDAFLRLEQRRNSEAMFAAVLTDDFQIGFRGGHQWKGRDGLQVYLNQRDGIFDERLELRHVLSYVPVNEDVVELTTRLEFFFRRWRAPSLVSEEFTGVGLSHVADPHR